MHNPTLMLSIDGGPLLQVDVGMAVDLGSSTSTTPACAQAMLEAQSGSTNVRISPVLVSRRRFNHCGLGRMTEDSPQAREHHAPGCRWRTGKNGERRGWECSMSCDIPELLAQEAADDE